MKRDYILLVICGFAAVTVVLGMAYLIFTAFQAAMFLRGSNFNYSVSVGLSITLIVLASVLACASAAYILVKHLKK